MEERLFTPKNDKEVELFKNYLFVAIAKTKTSGETNKELFFHDIYNAIDKVKIGDTMTLDIDSSGNVKLYPLFSYEKTNRKKISVSEMKKSLKEKKEIEELKLKEVINSSLIGKIYFEIYDQWLKFYMIESIDITTNIISGKVVGYPISRHNYIHRKYREQRKKIPLKDFEVAFLPFNDDGIRRNKQEFQFEEKIWNSSSGFFHFAKEIDSFKEIEDMWIEVEKSLIPIGTPLTEKEELLINKKFIDRVLTNNELSILISKRDDLFYKINKFLSPRVNQDYIRVVLDNMIPDYVGPYRVPLKKISMSNIEELILNSFLGMFKEYKERYNVSSCYEKFPLDIIRTSLEIISIFFTIKNDFVNLTFVNNFKANFDWNETKANLSLLENKLMIEIDRVKCSIGNLYVNSKAYKKMREEEIREAMMAANGVSSSLHEKIRNVPYKSIEYTSYLESNKKTYTSENQSKIDGYDRQLIKMDMLHDSLESEIGQPGSVSCNIRKKLVLTGNEVHKGNTIDIKKTEYIKDSTNIKTKIIETLDNFSEEELFFIQSFFEKMK
jgi:hypothetical protein